MKILVYLVGIASLVMLITGSVLATDCVIAESGLYFLISASLSMLNLVLLVSLDHLPIYKTTKYLAVRSLQDPSRRLYLPMKFVRSKVDYKLMTYLNTTFPEGFQVCKVNAQYKSSGEEDWVMASLAWINRLNTTD